MTGWPVVVAVVALWFGAALWQNAWADGLSRQSVYVSGRVYLVQWTEPQKEACSDTHPLACLPHQKSAAELTVWVTVTRMLVPGLGKDVCPRFEMPWAPCPDERCECDRSVRWVRVALRREHAPGGPR